MIISLIFLGISMLVSLILKGRLSSYSKVPLANGMSGKDVAEKMLKENGIYDVKVVSAEGFLSDHYNPVDKTVNLSPDVYNGTSVASAAVAAHECGHAVQHAASYKWLMLRSKMVPTVQFSSTLVNWILLIGVIMAVRGNPTLLLIGIILMSITTGVWSGDGANDPPLLFSDDFAKGADRWQPSDADAWKIVQTQKGHAYSQFRQSKYSPQLNLMPAEEP